MTHESTKLTLADVLPNAEYQARRKEFRDQVLDYKSDRTLALGPHLTLSFENRHTVRYQLQEMLALEKITERGSVARTLAACNELIPDGNNWKAGCFVVAPAKGRSKVQKALQGAEKAVWLRIAELPRISPIVEEDTEAGDSPVHFLCFELDNLHLAVLRAGGSIRFGVEHGEYRHEQGLTAAMRESLMSDLSAAAEPPRRDA
jgi:hypothetical protein